MALSVGDKAPDFTLVDAERKPQTLSALLKNGKTLVAFYPGAFTGVCTKEMCAFRDALAMLTGLKAQIVGISVDSPFANKAFADANKLTFPLLSDHTRDVSRKWAGLTENFAGIPGYSAAKRSVFLLDGNGSVKYVWISDNPGVEPPYEEVQKALGSF